jgi:hypothetical protein
VTQQSIPRFDADDTRMVEPTALQREPDLFSVQERTEQDRVMQLVTGVGRVGGIAVIEGRTLILQGARSLLVE